MEDVPGVMNFDDPEDEPLTMADVNKALTALFVAMGKGATPGHVKKALTEIAGVPNPRDVPEEGYAKVIREIDAMTAKYETGKLKLS